jgi:hypothetical protein
VSGEVPLRDDRPFTNSWIAPAAKAAGSTLSVPARVLIFEPVVRGLWVRCVARRHACPRVPASSKMYRLVPAKNRDLAIAGNKQPPICRVFLQAL